MRSSITAMFLLALTIAAAPAAWGAEARALTTTDIAGMGGTDFKGGVGDYLLRNDEIEAVVLGIDTTGDFGIPVIAEALPGRGILIDAGTLGDKNDQLGEIDHVVNLGEGVIFYGGPADGLPAPVFVSGGATASITVFGIVLLDPFPSGSLFVSTTYELTDGNSYIDIETTVTNFLPFPAPVFQIGDVDITVQRGRLPFQPFPNRGNKSPPLDLSDPAPSLGVWNYVGAPGNNGPSDGPTNNDGSPSGEVSYAFFADSVFTPLVGVAGGVVTVADCLEVYEPEMLRWIFASQRPNSEFQISFDLDVIKIYEDFDRAVATAYQPDDGSKRDKKRQIVRRTIELSGVVAGRIEPGQEPTRVPSFRPLSMILQIYDGDLDRALAHYEATGEVATDAERERFRARAVRVWNWILDFAPEEFCYRIRQTPSDAALTGEPREVLERLVGILEADPEISEVQLIPHLKTLCDGTSLTPQDFYPFAYDLLIARPKGPKLTTLLTTMGVERALPLLRAGLG